MEPSKSIVSNQKENIYLKAKCATEHTRGRALLLFQGLIVSSKFVFNVSPTKTEPQLWASSDRLEEPGIELGILGTRRVVNHNTTAATTSATP